MAQKTCLFCEIVQGNSQDTVAEYENDELLIINAPSPASDHHYLAIPKVHISNAKCFKETDMLLVNNLESALKRFMIEKSLDLNDTLFGYHWPPFIGVAHVNMIGITPISKMGTINKWIYKPGWWFRQPNYVKNWITRSGK